MVVMVRVSGKRNRMEILAKRMTARMPNGA